jgi:protein tyrosine phosphatase (PTP) superfamily phosphohydrolase (DUF442 family)
VVSYLVVVGVAHVTTLALVAAGRVVGSAPSGGELATVANLRRVDDKVWAGGQPDEEDDYRRLAAAGVRLVVDLRTGAADDEREDDPVLLRRLGMRYVHLPVPDGHAPDPAKVRRFVAFVRGTDGLVYLHCGGGVGRSTAMQAAYLAATGEDPRWWDLVAIGPITLEQGWFAATVDIDRPAPRNVVVRRISEALDAPRRAISRVRGLL